MAPNHHLQDLPSEVHFNTLGILTFWWYVYLKKLYYKNVYMHASSNTHLHYYKWNYICNKNIVSAKFS